MKVITEATLRNELRAEMPESYTVPDGMMLSPAAREYLQMAKIKVVEKKQNKPLTISYSEPVEQNKNPRITAEYKKKKFVSEEAEDTCVTAFEERKAAEEKAAEKKPKYVDEQTGAFYFEKPEHMTQLHGNLLVNKDDKRILFRGKLDSLEADFVLKQTELLDMGEDRSIVMDLEDVLGSIREIMKCDVLDLPFERETIIGLTHDELRAHSHNPLKYYKVKQMVLPSYKLGHTYAILNYLRAQVREVEVAAATAFNNGKGFDKADIIEELNRMSSAMHIIMCKYLAKIQSEEEN